MHKVLVNRLGGLSLPRKSVVRLTDRPDMTLDVYRGRKTTMQQQRGSILEVGKGNLQSKEISSFGSQKRHQHIFGGGVNFGLFRCDITNFVETLPFFRVNILIHRSDFGKFFGLFS